LLMLLLIAFKLIRSGGSRRDDAAVTTAPATANVAERADDEVIDLRDDVAASSIDPTAIESVMSSKSAAQATLPVYGDPVFAADGTPLPDGVFEAPLRTETAAATPALPAEPAPIPPPIGSPSSLSALSRSAIVIDSSLNGSGPTPSELLFSVIETLGSIGFALTKDSPDYGLLKDADDNTASIDLTKRPNGTDRIAIAVDSPRAVEALAMLEIWHRSRLGATDQVRLSARIR